MRKPFRTRWLRIAKDRSGVAALELALLLPLVLVIFFGMIDLTALIADARRVSYAANVAADMVTRVPTPITPANIEVAYDGVELVMETATTGPVRVEIFTYFLQIGNPNPVIRWSHTNGVGPDCADPSPDGLAALMSQGNDIVIAVVCANHTPIVANIITEEFMGTTDVLLQRQVTMRPRQSNQLVCPNNCI